MKKSLARLLDFQNLLAAFNQVERVVHRIHNGQYVRENDTEHSYNLAMTAWFLASSFPELDRDTVIRYALVHDVVEVHAGDTYIYGPEAELQSKHQREAEAIAKLATDWSDFGDMNVAIKAYEARLDPEARFVYALDKIMPIMQIYIHEGYSWKHGNITLEMLYAAKIDKIAQSPEILAYFEQLYTMLQDHPELIARV